MSALDFLLPWDSQPKEGTPVSPEGPTTSFSFLGGQVGDVATKRLWSLGSTSSRGVDSYGHATSPGTAGNSITQAGISAAAQTKCTFVCVFRIDTGREYSFLARTSTSNSGFAIGNGTGNSGGLSYGLHKGGAATLSEVVLTAGVTYVMVASHDQASGEYYVVARPIRGGATLRASGTNTTASSAGSGTASIGINASPNDFIGSVGLVWQAFEFLPEALSGIFLANPWQLFASQVIDGPVSAGGGAATDLTIQEAAHAHGADNLALTLDAFLAVADAAHAQAADNITLTTGGANLAVDETLHAQVADNSALTLDTFLAVQDATHGQTADNLALTLDVFLAIADALHAQATDNVTLTVGGIDLIIAEAIHAHAADNLAFTLDTFLAVADALHAQTADNLTLSLGGALTDAEFRQMYDWLQDLYGRQLLTVGTFLALK